MIIKEFYPTDRVGKYCFYIILRRNDYAHTLAALEELYQEARKDFGDITPEEATIQHYGGQRYRGTYGLEFATEVKPPADYALISSPELTL